MKSAKLFLIISAAFLCIGATECQQGSAPVTVSPALGSAAAVEKQETERQIGALKLQVQAAEQKSIETQKQAAAASGSVHGIQVAAEHVQPEAPKEAIQSESALAAEALKLPPDAPAELVAAYAAHALAAEKRVSLFLTGQRDAALKEYGKAMDEVAAQKKVIAAKEAEIVARQSEITQRDKTLDDMAKASQRERDDAARKLQTMFDEKQREIKKLHDEQAAKERRLWINVLRFGGIGFIAIGIFIIALSKGVMWIQGGITLLGGAATIGLGLAFDILTSQAWFPWAFGIAVLVVLVGVGSAAWIMHRKHVGFDKASAVFDDIRTESEELWKQVEPHVAYRFGQAGKGLRKVLEGTIVKTGLSEKAHSPKVTE